MIIQPTYVTTQPSTGKKITFRPFTVKEEKALLLALQESDIDTVAIAINNVIAACTDLDPKKIPYYDVEYIYLQIRSKSIGELIDMIGGCTCDKDAKTEFEIDVTEATVLPEPPKDTLFKIEGTQYTVKLEHPSMLDFAKLIKTNAEASFEVVANCITAVYTDEETLDWSLEEKIEFVESMTPRQQKLVSAFLKKMPMVQLHSKYKCKKCGLDHNRTTTGFTNFFL
jgi:hypothetical protein